jgi:signal transduction histidine kinase
VTDQTASVYGSEYALAVSRALARSAGLVVAAAGALVLMGWWFDLPAITTLIPGSISMKANTALCFVIIGWAQILLSWRGADRWSKSLALGACAIVWIIGGLNLIECVTNLNFGLDTLLAQDPLGAVRTRQPGRMSIVTAGNFVLIAIAGILAWMPARPLGSQTRAWLLTLGLLDSIAAVVSYIFDITGPYDIFGQNPMAPNTAALFTLAFGGMLCLRPSEGWLALLMSDTSGGLVLRRIALAIVLFPVLISWLVVKGQKASLYDTSDGISMAATLAIFGIGAAAWLGARRLNQIDAERDRLARQAMLEERERKSLEAQLRQAQKMEAVGQLTGGIAHDFNNLLTVVVGNLDSLVERLEVDEKGRKLAQDALSAGLSGAELTRKRLAFSRKQALETKAVDVNDLVRGTMELLRRSLGDKIEIEVSTAGNLWPVDTDPAQLESALLNLAVNSRDAMPDGGHLMIETTNSHLDEQYAAENPGVTPGDYVMLAVTDSGTGIPPEHLDRVIEPFFTTKEVGKGSGLGLSMIYGFAKQSGGHLKIYSEVGHGTSVRLYLPRGKAGPEAALRPTAQTAEPGAGELILVVDDNARVRDTVTTQLAELGYRTLEAANGALAIDLLKATPGVDLLFTDIVMPGGMTGVQLGEAAKQLRPEIGILYTSGFTEASLRGETAKGMAKYQLLSKPYRKRELAEKVRRALSRDRERG